MKKIVICGNYGATNLGDEAILAGILKNIRETRPETEITVMSANPRQTEKMHKVKGIPLIPAGFRSALRSIFGFQMVRTLNAIRKCNIFILGGGGLFTDEKPFAVIIWSMQAQFAYLFKKPVFMYAQSIGPLKTKWAKKAVKNIFDRAKVITVRDQESKKLLEEIGVEKEITIVCDPAFSLEPIFKTNLEQNPYVILSVRGWLGKGTELNKNLAQYVDWLWGKHRIKTKLMPFQEVQDNDALELNKIFEQVEAKEACEVLKWEWDLDKIFGIFRGAKFVVGMRLHSLIFSCLCERPFIGLMYSQKVENFLREIGLYNMGIGLNEVSSEKLISITEKLMREKSALESQISNVLTDARDSDKTGKNLLTNLTFLL
jgi:polysaccharide pyruvyl transferase CsaB